MSEEHVEQQVCQQEEIKKEEEEIKPQEEEIKKEEEEEVKPQEEEIKPQEKIKMIKIEVFNNYGTINFVSDKVEIPTFNSAKEIKQEEKVEEEPKKEEVVEKQPKVEEEPKKEELNLEEFKVVIKEDKTELDKVITKLGLVPKHLEKLKEWTNKSDFKIIYNNDNDDFNAKTFFSKVKGIENAMIFCLTTSNLLFGGYWSKMPTAQNKWITDDYYHFVFTIRNPHMVPPTMFKPRVENKNLLLIKPDSDNFAIFENYAMNIFNDSTSKQNIRFSSAYHDTTKKGDKLFTGNQRVFQIRNLVCVQWE